MRKASSSPSKRISIRISFRVRLRSVKIIEPEMSPYFWPCLLLNWHSIYEYSGFDVAHTNQVSYTGEETCFQVPVSYTTRS